MKSRTALLIATNVLIFNLILVAIYFKRPDQSEQPKPSDNLRPITGAVSKLPTKPELEPISNQISRPRPEYLNYEATVAQLKQWHKEAPLMTEIGTYGKSSRNRPLYFLKISNNRPGSTTIKPRVLLTACIHGNEPLASSTMMWHIGTMLARYGTDPEVTELLDSREIYFIPVVSPDSYPNSRYVDGVDPNRDFPSPRDPNHQSVAPVAALQKFFKEIKPKAIISGHTWGRVLAFPYGDMMQDSPDHSEYTRIVGQMSRLSGYKSIRLCDMYQGNGKWNVPPIQRSSYTVAMPIYGAEADWYYRHGAFALVMEFGLHQRLPKRIEIQDEFERTYRAVLHFIREAPLVHLKIRGSD